MLQWIKLIFGIDNNKPNLTELLNSGAVLIDVRTKAEYLGGSAAKAVNIPLDQLMQKIVNYSKDQQIIVFCRSGMRSGQAKRQLEQNGYTKVYNAGGIGTVLRQLK